MHTVIIPSHFHYELDILPPLLTRGRSKLILCFLVRYSKQGSKYTFPKDRMSIWRIMGNESTDLGTFQPETSGFELSSVNKGKFTEHQ